MAIGDVFPYTVPPVGTAGPSFATSVNNILTETIARLSTKVPLASIDFNSVGNLAGSPLLDAGYITLTNTLTTPAASPVNRLTAFGGDFWYVSPSGPIQITSGSTLNAAGVGGITGDYGGGNPAQFRFVDADQRYDAYDNFGTSTFAYIRARGFDVAGGAVSAVFARLQYAGASSRTFTLPPDPASTANPQPLYMDNSGNITVGHTNNKSFTYSAIGCRPSNAPGGYGDLNMSLVEGSVALNSVAGQRLIKGVDYLPGGFVITSVVLQLAKLNTTSTGFSFCRSLNGGSFVSLGGVTSVVAGPQALTIALSHTVDPTFNYSVFADLVGNTNDRWSGFTINGFMPR